MQWFLLIIDKIGNQQNKLENLNCQNHKDAEDANENQVNY